jgi:hypothetical protein
LASKLLIQAQREPVETELEATVRPDYPGRDPFEAATLVGRKWDARTAGRQQAGSPVVGRYPPATPWSRVRHLERQDSQESPSGGSRGRDLEVKGGSHAHRTSHERREPPAAARHGIAKPRGHRGGSVTTYRAGWRIACTALLLIGAAAAIHASTEALPVAFVVVALTLTLVSLSAVRRRRDALPGPVRARIVATSALLGGITAAALVGFAGLLGERVALLGVVVLVSSPSAMRTYGRWLRSVPTPSAAQMDAFARVFAVDMGYGGIQLPPDPRTLTDEELCQRWHASCLYLRMRPSAAQVVREVEQRQTYLDEFERRCPSGYAAWLTSGAATLDNLTPYVIGGRVDHAVINWDELTGGRDS